MSLVNSLVVPAALALAIGGLLAGSGPAIPREPANVSVVVEPETVASGGEARVTLEISPKSGVKLNRYPKIKLSIPAQADLVAKAEASVGSDAPPPPEKLELNYFDHAAPLALTLHLAAAVAPGRHEVKGQLTYNYCVPASGFCAPARMALTIPLQVR
jgi:DsbC/DsbD-like thiol-disulfide interchange protein